MKKIRSMCRACGIAAFVHGPTRSLAGTARALGFIALFVLSTFTVGFAQDGDESEKGEAAKEASAPEAITNENKPPAMPKDPMVLYDKKGLKVRLHFQAGLNLVKESNLFFDLADIFAPEANFNADPLWFEAYVKPGISVSKEFRNRVTAYGKFSIVGAGTVGTDAFDNGDTGRILVEEAYGGLRYVVSDKLSLDFSAGSREFKVGSGMLISNGASNGFQRGSLKLGPRKAWQIAGLATVRYGKLASTFFYLGPNELPQSKSGTRLFGGDVRYDLSPGNYFGATFGRVPRSDSPYPKAGENGQGPPEIIQGAREGLGFVNFYTRFSPLKASLPGLFVVGDLALERNGRIDLEAWAGRVQVGYDFGPAGGRDWWPTITYSYQTFSGDDPFTTKQERFDPLFYEGSPSAWATGSKSAMLFLNSNVNSHQLIFQFTPTVRSTISLRLARIGANELRSPIQFGQGTRLDVSDGSPNVVVGATDPRLADDLYIEYFYMLNRNVFITAGVSGSKPGEGLRGIASSGSPNSGLSNWNGGYVNVIFNY